MPQQLPLNPCSSASTSTSKPFTISPIVALLSFSSYPPSRRLLNLGSASCVPFPLNPYPSASTSTSTSKPYSATRNSLTFSPASSIPRAPIPILVLRFICIH